MLSSEMVRECSDVAGDPERESQVETREKDFFLRSGGRGEDRIRGRGGGGSGATDFRRGDLIGGKGVEAVEEEDEVAEKAADA